jgi:hypothetical protein
MGLCWAVVVDLAPQIADPMNLTVAAFRAVVQVLLDKADLRCHSSLVAAGRCSSPFRVAPEVPVGTHQVCCSRFALSEAVLGPDCTISEDQTFRLDFGPSVQVAQSMGSELLPAWAVRRRANSPCLRRN